MCRYWALTQVNFNWLFFGVFLGQSVDVLLTDPPIYPDSWHDCSLWLVFHSSCFLLWPLLCLSRVADKLPLPSHSKDFAYINNLSMYNSSFLSRTREPCCTSVNLIILVWRDWFVLNIEGSICELIDGRAHTTGSVTAPDMVLRHC